MTTAKKPAAVKVSAKAKAAPAAEEKKPATKATVAAKVGVSKAGVQTEGAAPKAAGTKASKTEVKTAAKNLSAATKPAKSDAPKVDRNVEFVRLPKGDEKVSPQAQVILDTLSAMAKKDKKVSVSALVEKLENDGKLNTKQPAGAIWNHYRRKLEDAGFIKL